MSHWRRSPRPFGVAIDGIRDELAPQTLLSEIQRAWPQAVGKAIAVEAQPSAERGGVLTISCSASVWAHELDLMGPTIVERLNGVLGGGEVTRLRCVTLPGP
jgi:predicted nucleic acid-binding Zn ribbon protein